MTNGEKLKEIFPDIEFTEMAYTVHAVAGVTSNGVKGHISYDFWKDWWNAEYKEPNSSENPISSTTKSETLVNLDVYNQVAKERDMAIQQLHELGYELGIKIPDIKYHSHHCVDRRLVEALVHRYLREGTDNHIAFYEELLDLPLVTPLRPKGHWIDKFGGEYRCSCCREVVSIDTEIEFPNGITYKYCPYCGSHNLVKIEKEGDKE